MLDQSFVNHVSCFGANDGSYIAVVDSLNPLGSSASPFAFWNPNALPNPFYDPLYTPQGNMLGPDTIVIQIQDALGCQASDTIIIIEPELLEITHFDTLTYIGGYNVSCNGSLDGEIIVNAVGGTPIYSYWVQNISTTHPASNNDTISGLAATYYQAFVEDNNGCLDSLEIFMTQPDSLLINSFFLDTTIAGGWNVSCFGFSDGQATVDVSGGNLGYSYAWSNGDTTNIADTLSANTSYTVTVTDTNGCIVAGSTAILTEPTPLVIDNIIPTHLLCLGGDNGNATVFVSGATPGYAYLWDNANDTIPTYFNPNDTVASLNDTTAFADTLRAGTYNVEVWDTNGCYVTQSVTITEPSISITIDSLAVTQMTCFTWNNADVKVFTTGPQPTPYLYTLYNEADELDIIYPLTPMSPSPQGNVAFSALYALTYVVYVEDNLGCLDRDTFIINPLDSVYIDSVIYSNVSCYGYDDGYIEVIMPMGGIPPYQYSIDGGPLYPSWICNQNPNTCPTGFVFSGLAPGAYTVEIWDSNMCANSYQIIITEPPPMIIVDSTSNYNNYEIACNGGTDNVWFDIEGGATPYSVTDGSSTYPTNGSFTWTSLAAGAHTFTITDNNGCEQVFNITLNEPPAISVSPIITDVFCAGGSTGNITAVVSGGVGQGIGTNYTYQWTAVGSPGTVLSTSYFINNLSTGDYLLEVTDANGCMQPFTYTIGADALQIDISASTVNDVGCNGDCDASISIVVQGGVPSSTGAYTYLWDDPLTQTTQTAIGLCAGPYTCIVTDMDGCIETASFIVNQPVAFEADISVYSPIQCNDSTGSLTVSATLPISTYLWSSGGSALVEPNLIAGSYSCFVTDANGCTDEAHYYLDEPDVLDISTTDFSALCHGEATGEIHVVATGGTPIPGTSQNWTYELFPGPTTAANPIVGGTAIFTGLSTGIYTVTVTDFHGCDTTSGDIFVGEPDNDLEITIDYNDESCALNDAGATVYPTGGTPSYTVVWDGLSTTPHLTPQILSSGSNVPHTVVVTDANGCSVTESITLLGYENVFPGNASSFSGTYCVGDQILIDIDERPGLSYVWTISNGDTIATTANLNVTSDSSWISLMMPAGNTLMLTITDDATGCYQTVTAIIDMSPIIPGCTVLNEEAPITIIEGTEITLSSNNGYNTYQWTNADGEELSTVNEFNFSPTNSDWYNLFVTDGPCIGYCSVYVAVGVGGTHIVDAISPDGDGFNDDWYIEDLNKYDNSVVQLFNRWGDMLFEYKGGSDRITNNDFDWESLSIGTYYYIIDLGDGSLPQTGPLTIIK
jgi:gliding motility-associated-like protein